MDTWIERRKLMRLMYRRPERAAAVAVKYALCILVLVLLGVTCASGDRGSTKPELAANALQD